MWAIRLSIVVVDKRGRIVVPSRLRRKLGLKYGDAFIAVNIGSELLVLKKVDVEKLVKEIAEEVAKAGLDLEEIDRLVEEEANGLAKERVHES